MIVSKHNWNNLNCFKIIENCYLGKSGFIQSMLDVDIYNQTKRIKTILKRFLKIEIHIVQFSENIHLNKYISELMKKNFKYFKQFRRIRENIDKNVL